MLTASYEIEENPNELILIQRRFPGFFVFTVFGLGFALPIWATSKMFTWKELLDTKDGVTIGVSVIYYVFIVLLLAIAIWGLWRMISPDVFRLDKTGDAVLRNGRHLFSLSDIKTLSADRWLTVPARYRWINFYRVGFGFADGRLIGLDHTLCYQDEANEVVRIVAQFIHFTYQERTGVYTFYK